MEPIEVLLQEHRAIERVLQALDQYAADRSAASTAQADLLQFVEFIQGFADRIHHGKEEDVLFEQMVLSGFPRDAGPLAVMYHEHEQGRALARELQAFGDKDGPWSAAERQRVNEAAHRLTKLLRQHIHKEDHILYPMAQSRLGPRAMELVGAAFVEREAGEGQEGEKRRLLGMADRLVDRYATQAL